MYSKNLAIAEARSFIRLLRKIGITVKKAFVFGSVVKNRAREHSDIDLAIISPDFHEFRFDDLGTIAPYKIKANPDLEVHTFTSSDFSRSNPFAREIMDTGLKVA